MALYLVGQTIYYFLTLGLVCSDNDSILQRYRHAHITTLSAYTSAVDFRIVPV